MNSHPIKELYEFTPHIESGPSDRPNPLTTKGSLNGAEFIDIRLSTQRSRVGIIFDIRGLTFEGSNTALLVLTGVGNASWSAEKGPHSWAARPGDWQPTTALRPNPPPPLWAGGKEWAQTGGLWAMDAAGLSSATAAGTPTSDHVSNASTIPPAADSALPQRVPEDKTIAEYTLTRMGSSDSLTVSAHHAELYVGHVEGMDVPRPGMCDESDASVIVGFPQWSSVIVVREHYSYPEP